MDRMARILGVWVVGCMILGGTLVIANVPLGQDWTDQRVWLVRIGLIAIGLGLVGLVGEVLVSLWVWSHPARGQLPPASAPSAESTRSALATPPDPAGPPASREPIGISFDELRQQLMSAKTTAARKAVIRNVRGRRTPVFEGTIVDFQDDDPVSYTIDLWSQMMPARIVIRDAAQRDRARTLGIGAEIKATARVVDLAAPGSFIAGMTTGPTGGLLLDDGEILEFTPSPWPDQR